MSCFASFKELLTPAEATHQSDVCEWLGVCPDSGAYAVPMTRFVIDAPTLLHLVDNSLAVDPSHQLVAPSSVRTEALQLLLNEVRRGRRTEKDALQTHTQITELKMRLLGDRVSRGTAWKIALENDWETLRDAEYLAITRLQADALVTVDPNLAARAEGVVTVAPVQALLDET